MDFENAPLFILATLSEDCEFRIVRNQNQPVYDKATGQRLVRGGEACLSKERRENSF